MLWEIYSSTRYICTGTWHAAVNQILLLKQMLDLNDWPS